jgi:hypothetical protein
MKVNFSSPASPHKRIVEFTRYLNRILPPFAVILRSAVTKDLLLGDCGKPYRTFEKQILRLWLRMTF